MSPGQGRQVNIDTAAGCSSSHTAPRALSFSIRKKVISKGGGERGSTGCFVFCYRKDRGNEFSLKASKGQEISWLFQGCPQLTPGMGAGLGFRGLTQVEQGKDGAGDGDGN